MDDLIRQMIQGYLDGFNMYEITSSSLEEEVDTFKTKLTQFAEANQDINTFHQRLAESGLQEEYSNVITKVAMASMAPSSGIGSETESTSEDSNSWNRNADMKSGDDTNITAENIVFPTVPEFVEQYRVSYDAVKKDGYRKKGEAAYEAIFDVANRASDMVEAQIIMEQERLLWNIVKDDSLDIFEPILAAMDPLDKAVNATMKAQVNAYLNSDSDEELTYNLEVAEHEKKVIINHFIAKKVLFSQIALMLTKYCKCKITIYEWNNDKAVKSAIKGMIALRKGLRRSLEFISHEWGMTFADLFDDEGVKINMLLPVNADALGRIKTSLNPQNLYVFKDIIENEIMEENISIKDILLRQSEKAIWFDLDGAEKKEYETSAEKRAEELNSDLVYYVYGLKAER